MSMPGFACKENPSSTAQLLQSRKSVTITESRKVDPNKRCRAQTSHQIEAQEAGKCKVQNLKSANGTGQVCPAFKSRALKVHVPRGLIPDCNSAAGLAQWAPRQSFHLPRLRSNVFASGTLGVLADSGAIST